MLYQLLNKDRVVLEFDFEDAYLSVKENQLLPYELKDFVQTTKLESADDLKKALRDLDVLKDFFVSRTLNLSRDNAKVILNIANLPQSLHFNEKLKITFACRGLSMNDNFWIKFPEEEVVFDDVCLRKKKLSEASYEIAILGHHISATADELQPDLSTAGMFAKTWRRNNNTVEMWKTDKTSNFINTSAEVTVSDILETSNVCSVRYHLEKVGEHSFAVSECISDDDKSFIPAVSVADWCIHTNRNFLEFIKKHYMEDFSKMCVVDYVLANTDRHLENWGFFVDANTNEIMSIAPLFDHNQALIADMVGTDIRDLMYSPTNQTFLQTLHEFAKYANLELDESKLPAKCKERYDEYLKLM